jgi:Icc-related predicted phosphoesterase
MKICAISDTHRRRPVDLPEADLLIHAGDIGSHGSAVEIEAEIKWLATLKPKFPKGIVYVPGNHDLALDADMAQKEWEAWVRDPYHRYKPKQDSKGQRVAQYLMDVCDQQGVHILIDEDVEIDGIKVYGSPYTPIFYDWAFMENEEDLSKRWAKIPEDVHVLVTHGPAQGIRDLCSGGNVGSSSLRYAIDYRFAQLKAHIFGHIHEGAGLSKIIRPQGDYVAWNAAVLDGNYQGFNKINVIEVTVEPSSEQTAET